MLRVVKLPHVCLACAMVCLPYYCCWKVWERERVEGRPPCLELLSCLMSAWLVQWSAYHITAAGKCGRGGEGRNLALPHVHWVH